MRSTAHSAVTVCELTWRLLPLAGQTPRRNTGDLIKGKTRPILIDTLGLLLHAPVTAADVQDRDGGLMLLSTMFGQFLFRLLYRLCTLYYQGVGLTKTS